MPLTVQELTGNKTEGLQRSQRSASEGWTGDGKVKLWCPQVPLYFLMFCVLLAFVRNDQGPTAEKRAEKRVTTRR